MFRIPSPFDMKTCRFGTGTETKAGLRDTPGFPIRDEPSIEMTNAGFKKLKMPRNHSRLNQCSTDALRSWRANCDVQVFVYDSPPDRLDPHEIARVTDYTVGYSCKGHQTQGDERDQMVSFVNAYNEQTGDERDVTKLTRQLLNRAAVNRIVSKQECMVLLLGLDMVKCTDCFDKISTSGKVRLALKNSKCGKRDLQQQYAMRNMADVELRSLSLHEFFHRKHNQKAGMKLRKWHIPVYTGASVRPMFPPSRKYAESLFYIHRPWQRSFLFVEGGWRDKFEHFMFGGSCPPTARIAYEREIIRFHDY